jgi:hypothetical protein
MVMGHVQATRKSHAFQGLLTSIFFAQRHEAGHFGLCDCDFFPAPVGERDVGDLVI